MANKVVKMVLNRNYVLRTTLGHSVAFKKGEPINVPAIIAKSAAEIGAERVDGKDVFEAPVEAPVQPVDPSQRGEDIRKAVETIVDRNAIKDFTAGGTPKVAAVSAQVGYKVDQVEVAKAWAAHNEDLENET